MNPNDARKNGWSAFWAAVCLAATPALWSETVIYETGFENEEGYSTEIDLSDQNGWKGGGADGILTNFFEGLGQQAYIGFTVPKGATNDSFSVYRPVNLVPATNQALIQFSVRMQIVDSTSTNGPWDSFRWSIYNTNGTRLFSIDFDNSALLIAYVLEDGKDFVSTGLGFDSQGYYDLGISMNFARNLWSATLNDEVIINAQPITTAGSPLTLGDIDAVWVLRDPAFPGDNFMIFDDYNITAGSTSSIAPRLETVGIESGGSYHARLYGEPGLDYRIEASTNLVDWQPLLTITAPAGGVLDFRDSTAPTFPQRFYRAKQGR